MKKSRLNVAAKPSSKPRPLITSLITRSIPRFAAMIENHIQFADPITASMIVVWPLGIRIDSWLAAKPQTTSG